MEHISPVSRQHHLWLPLLSSIYFAYCKLSESKCKILSRLINPFTKYWRCLLAHDDRMIDIRHRKIDLQFYFFIRFKTFDIINIDDILPVCPEKFVLI